MSNRVLEFFREREPRFRDVPDDKLTRFIGEQHPDFLRDERFRDVFTARRDQSANTQSTADEGTLKRRALRVGEGLAETAKDVAETAGSGADPYTTGKAIRGAASVALEAGMEGVRAETDRNMAEVRRRTELARTNWPVALQTVLADMTSPGRAVLEGAGGLMAQTGKLLREDARKGLGLTPLDPAGPVSQGLQDAAGSAPVLGAGMALQAAGVPAPLAFAVPSGAQTLAETGDPAAASLAAAKMALVPEVLGASRSVAAGGVRSLVERGVFPVEATTSQKVVEALGGQVGVQAFMEAMNLPEYAQMDPEQRRNAIRRSLVANTAFMAMDVPTVLGKGPSQTQAGLSPQARAGLAIRELVNDPAAVEALKYVADEVAVRGLDSRRRATTPVPYNVRGPDVAGEVDWQPGPPPVPERPDVAAPLPRVEPPPSVVEAAPAPEGAKPGEAKPPENPPAEESGWLAGSEAETVLPRVARTKGGLPAVKLLVKQRADGTWAASYGLHAGTTGVADPLRGSHATREEAIAAGREESSAWVERELARSDNPPKTIKQLKAIREELGTLAPKAPDETKATDVEAPAPVKESKPADAPKPKATAEQEAERTKAERRVDENTKVAALIEEAQQIADSAPKQGSAAAKAGGLTASKVKAGLIERIQTALAEAPDEVGAEGKPGKVVIGVPGDGVFVLSNSRKTLSGALKRAKAMETSTAPPQEGKATGVKTPKLGAAKPGEFKKLLEPFVSEDETRLVLAEPWSDGQRTLATNGAVGVELKGAAGAGGPEGFPVKSLDSMWGKDWDVGPFTVASDELWRAGRIARRMEADSNGLRFIDLTGRKGGIYAEMTDAVGDVASYGKPGEGDALGRFQGRYVEDLAELARKLNSSEVRIGLKRTENGQQVLAIEGDKFRAIVARAQDPKESRPTGKAEGEQVEAYPPEAGTEPRTEPTTAAEEDLFANSAERMVTEEAYPGGPLGTEPSHPANDPEFSVFPMELPEAVQLARQLLGGKTPKLVEKIRALKGKALGVFRHNDTTGEASIEMIRSVFELPESERQRLMGEAQAYADMVGATERERAAVVAHRYEQLKRQEFMHNPVVALKVLWHEIGHVVDWLPDHTIQGRGNLLGRLASLKDYLKDTLPEVPGVPDNPITAKDRERLRAEAQRQMVAEVGPLEEIVRKIMVEEPQWQLRGVTPEDVKNLFGMSAREQFPELYLWFAEQPAAVKKEIVKSAMRNMVDPRLTRFQSREQVGTRMVEREIRSRKGRAPTPEEIQKRFQDLLRDEIRQRRLVELSQVKAELEPLIAWWRGAPKMEKYFAKSSEMYAEAFSIFANNPAAMALRAPTYHRVLMNYMDAKPEVAALYRQIQEQIRSGAVMGDRVQRLRDSWNHDDQQSLDRLDRGGKVPLGQWIDNVRYHLDRRFGPVYRVAGGAKRNPQVREALGNMLYRGADHERFLGAVNRQVARPLGQVSLEWNDLAEYLFHQHVVGSRFRRSPDNGELVMIGNPHGWTPKNSIERLELMKQQLGPERWAVLESAHKNMRQIYEHEVIDLLHRTQMFSPELMAAIEERIFYAPFQAAKGEITDGIQSLLDASFGPDVGPRIYRQVGNLGDIKNPATALVLKGTSLQSAAYRNEARRQTVLAMLEAEPEWIQEAQMGPDGRPYFRETDKVGTLTFLRNGKVHAYYVPRTIADAVNGGPPLRSLATMGAMKAARGVKALLTQLNAGWWPFAFAKDAATWVLQVPKAGPVDYVRHIVPALRSSMAYASQGYTPLRQDVLAAMGGKPAQRRVTESGLVEEALGRKMLIAHADYGRNQDQVANEFDRKLIQVGLDPVFWGQQLSLGQKFHRAWERYKGLGQALERSHKIAGMTYLDEAHPNMPEWQKAEIVRERAGSPDFLQRGHMSPQVELLGMFLNPWKEGVRSLLKAGRESPGTFAGKVAAGVIGPSVFQAVLASGIAGEDMKRKYRSISDYDKSNYFIVPLGWQDAKRTKASYLRIPLPDSFRLLHSLVWHGLTGEDRGLGSVVGGNVPGVSPLLTTFGMWASYMQGRNPYDSFRGRELLNPDVFTTGGGPAHAVLLKETWNQLGGSIVHRFQSDRMDDPPPDEMEKVLALPGISNVVGRWIKVSGAGWGDDARRAAQPIAVREAEQRIAGRDIASAILDGRPLTDAQKALAHQPKVQSYMYEILARAQKARVGLPGRAIQRLPSKAQKQAAELEQIRQGR